VAQQLREACLVGQGTWHSSDDLTLGGRGDESQPRLCVISAASLGGDERPRGLVLVLREVTEERQLRQRLQQAERLESIGQLTGGIAHDFNNMLGAISGAAEMQAQHDHDAELRRRYRDTILDSCAQAADLTRKLLAFARQEQGHMRRIDLVEVARHAEGLLTHTVDRRIRVEVEAPQGAAVVLGDRSGLVNVLLNMGLNARDAMPQGGTLRFIVDHWRRDDGVMQARLRVRDTGHGIPPQIRDRIFEPFFTTKPRGKGTGLGLSAVYGTVSTHGGSIGVDSQAGAGTTFTILLPLVSGGPEDSTTAATLDPEQAPVGSGRVLLADDDDLVRQITADMLRSLGYEVLAVADGRAALDTLEREGPAIRFIVLDLIMPVVNGADAFTALRERGHRQPVIFASGYGEDIDVTGLLSNRSRAMMLRKPFRRSDLADVLARIARQTDLDG
jgi:signal transduction histidine kinase/ActR/RegA family two-component response regulator